MKSQKIALLPSARGPLLLGGFRGPLKKSYKGSFQGIYKGSYKFRGLGSLGVYGFRS